MAKQQNHKAKIKVSVVVMGTWMVGVLGGVGFCARQWI